MFKLGNGILSLLEVVFEFWNFQVGLVFELLGESPDIFKGGTPWKLIMGIEPLFVAVGSSLVVLFFIMGFCAESISIREEMRFEVIVRMLLRISIAEWLVANNLMILKAFFTSIGNLVKRLGMTNIAAVSISETEADIIKNLDFAPSLIFMILTVFLSLIIIICSFFLLYTVYFRILRILVIIPFATIAFSTLAGNRAVSSTCVHYFKYFLSVVIEAVTMTLGILVCNSFIQGGLPAFTGNFADWAKTLIYLAEITFTISLTVGAVKGAQNLTSKVLGL